jgi:L-fuconolactonase
MKKVNSSLNRYDSESKENHHHDEMVNRSNRSRFGELSRRDFLIGTLPLVAAPLSGFFPRQFSTNPLGSDYNNADNDAVTIIDTHTHFFDPTRTIPSGRDRSIPWPTPNSNLYKTTLPSDWEKLAKPLGMNGTIVVEAGTNWLEDNDWILMLADRYRSIVGLIGNLSGTAIDKGKTVPVWDNISRFDHEVHRLASNSLFRGIRVGGNSVSGDLKGGRYPHFEILADAGLVIDVLGVPAADVVAMARAVPSLSIVVDHMFNITGTANPSMQWRSDIMSLAEVKNIVMKVSGLVEGLDSLQTDPGVALTKSTSAMDHVYNAFGPDRLVFGTNWPVSEPKGQMSVVTEIVRRYFEPKGKDILSKVFAGNAKKVYKYIDR